MAEPRFADHDDDLPRTLRREREARDREQREREREQAAHDEHPAGVAGMPPQSYADPYAYDQSPRQEGIVTRLEIPFGHLVVFFIKAVFAAIPALLLLTVLLWGAGQALKAFFPGLRHLEIIVKSVG